MDTPKAFLSHATEDKERFAVPFAEALISNGIDVWMDQWEIKAGDSLVKKIFTDGIDEADVFIVVISPISLLKPWVADELDAGVVRKIAGACKLIPIVLDDAEVPPALKHSLWISATKLGLDGAVAEVVRSVFGISIKPPLGAPPSYLSVEQMPRLSPDPTDNVVLNAIVDLSIDPKSGVITSDALAAKVSAYGISREHLEESAGVLSEAGHVTLQRTMGRGAWFVTKLRDATLLDVLTARGVDVQGIERRLLLSLVNNPHQRILTFEDAEPVMVAAILRTFVARGLVTGIETMGGGMVVSSVSPKARRVARQL